LGRGVEQKTVEGGGERINISETIRKEGLKTEIVKLKKCGENGDQFPLGP